MRVLKVLLLLGLLASSASVASAACSCNANNILCNQAGCFSPGKACCLTAHGKGGCTAKCVGQGSVPNKCAGGQELATKPAVLLLPHLPQHPGDPAWPVSLYRGYRRRRHALSRLARPRNRQALVPVSTSDCSRADRP
ncbi:hypothetical protein ABPG75_007260 [Micractinium tetrahymenae]